MFKIKINMQGEGQCSDGTALAVVHVVRNQFVQHYNALKQLIISQFKHFYKTFFLNRVHMSSHISQVTCNWHKLLY